MNVSFNVFNKKVMVDSSLKSFYIVLQYGDVTFLAITSIIEKLKIRVSGLITRRRLSSIYMSAVCLFTFFSISENSQ